MKNKKLKKNEKYVGNRNKLDKEGENIHNSIA
jgi:hypothetical protein